MVFCEKTEKNPSPSKARGENEVFVWFSIRKKAGICTRKKERTLKSRFWSIFGLPVKKPKPKTSVKTHLECRYPGFFHFLGERKKKPGLKKPKIGFSPILFQKKPLFPLRLTKNRPRRIITRFFSMVYKGFGPSCTSLDKLGKLNLLS
jgi:hypothetical protein